MRLTAVKCFHLEKMVSHKNGKPQIWRQNNIDTQALETELGKWKDLFHAVGVSGNFATFTHLIRQSGFFS